MSTYAITTDRHHSTATDVGASFVDALFVSMIVAALPVKNLAYLAPPLFILLQALWGNRTFLWRTVFWGSLIFCVSALSITIDTMAGRVVNPPGMLWGALLALRPDFSITTERWKSLRCVVSWFVIIQSLLGVLQFLASGDQDAVCGTFGLFDFLGGVTIAQVYLTFNLFGMIMFLMADKRTRLDYFAIVIGLMACLLAHSGHQTLFFIAALAIVGMLQMRLRDTLKLGAVMAVLVTLMFSVSSITSGDMNEWQRKLLREDDSPKRIVTISAVQLMTGPKNLLLGTAIGQYASRAALMSSGGYLSADLPTMLKGESQYFRQFVLPALYEFEDHGEGSAISQPSYSVMNLIVELGLPLALVLCFVLAYNFYRNWQLARSDDPHARAVGMWANVGLVFFVACSFIENYVEFPQAIFLPALLYFAALSTTKSPTENRTTQSPVSVPRLRHGRTR
jgi:hypothetical protein